jgi:hypothetical protein
MKIQCSFCGSTLDPSKHSECPYCGAKIGNNEAYQEYESKKQQFYDDMRELHKQEAQERIEKQQIENERKKIENERLQKDVRRQRKFKPILKLIKLVIIWPAVIFCLLCVAILIIAINSPDTDNSTETTVSTEFVPEHHSIMVGEIVSFPDWDFVLEECREYTPASYAIREGYKYVKFKFSITNTSDEKLPRTSNIWCYDSNGKSCDIQYSLSAEDKSQRIQNQYIQPEKTYSAWEYFIIPEGETQILVQYGDYIEISIDLEKDLDAKSEDTVIINPTE